MNNGSTTTVTSERARTGIPGLDDILGGGLPRNRLYLIQGDPGVGKTTLGLQFLLEGVANGETSMYVTLSETVEEIEGVAASHGWSLDDVNVHEHSAGEVRQAMSVFKRRGGAHERSIREIFLGPPEGIKLGEPLRRFRGVLTGVPIYDSSREENA